MTRTPPRKDPGVAGLAEDVLLALFQPHAGTIAGESTLCHVLAGAVLAELALDEAVTVATTASGFAGARATPGRMPSDEILRPAWDYVAGSPGPLQGTLAAIGPALRQPLLERLIARGDLRETNGKVLGVLKTTKLIEGGSGRRQGLIRDVRSALAEGTDPAPRVAALAALIWGSGTLQQFDPEIPWNPAVIARAEAFGRGDWGGEGADQAAAGATAAMIGVIVAAMPGQDQGRA